jgi:long-subunit acyl-CoA synthetase (AMP-forming)
MAAYLHRNFNDEKKHVGILSKNCAHWILADLAISYAGGVSVPFYPTLSAEQFRTIYEHSDCQILFVGKLDNWEQIKEVIPAETVVIHMSDQPNDIINTWEQIILKERKTREPYVFKEDETITIIYTSGTTGTPKGVMISAKSITIALKAAREIAYLDHPNNRFISYLPLCHVAERNFVEYAGTASGGTIYFVENLQTFAANLKSASPTHFLAVPRIWLKFQEGIVSKFGGQKSFEKILKIPILGQLIIHLIIKKLGLSKAKLLITGAAPISPELLNWYQDLGLRIQEAYGMTENLGLTSVMPKNKIQLGTVGKIWPICEVRIQEGEIQMKSDYVMQGYYKELSITKQTFEDGWLKTGDAGTLGEDGFLKITGRIKENFKTSKGFYVSPATIETHIQNHPLVDQVCVVGANLPEPMALVVLKEESKELDSQAVNEQLEDLFISLNPHFKHYEMIKKIIVIQEPWTVENSCMTPTLKIRRLEIERVYERYFGDWFKSKNKIIYF